MRSGRETLHIACMAKIIIPEKLGLYIPEYVRAPYMAAKGYICDHIYNKRAEKTSPTMFGTCRDGGTKEAVAPHIYERTRGTKRTGKNGG